MPGDGPRIRSSLPQEMSPSTITTACASSLGLRPESGGGDGESDAQSRCAGYDDAPWLWSDQYQHNIQILGIPQAGCRTILREEALYFSLDDNGRLTQLVAFNDARTVKLAKRWMAAGRDLSDVPLADPTFSLMSLR